MIGLTLSAVDLLCLEQVGGGNRGMMLPWDVGIFVEGPSWYAPGKH